VEVPLPHFQLDALLHTILFIEPHSRNGIAVYPHDFLWIGRTPGFFVTGP